MPRRVPLMAALSCALLAAACGNMGDGDGYSSIRVSLKISYPDAQTADAAKELLFLLRDAQGQAEECDLTLFDMQGTALSAIGTLVDRAGTIAPLYTPKDEGVVDLFVYTYPRALDRFCSADADCAGSETGSICTDIGLDRASCSAEGGEVQPNAGGCTRVTLMKDESPMIQVTLSRM